MESCTYSGQYPKLQLGGLIRIASLLILLTCIFVRTYMLIFPKDMWIDELYIWEILSNESIGDILTGHLSGSLKTQSAPILFMLFNKLLFDTLGDSQVIFYILPYICSCLALFFLWSICEKFGKIYIFSSLLVYSLCLVPAYYATEFKQYGPELLVSLVLLHSAIRNSYFIKSGKNVIFSTPNILLYIFCILFATTAPLYLAGTLTVQCICYLRWKRAAKPMNLRILLFLRQNGRNILFLFLVAVVYYIFYLGNTNSDHMKNYWAEYMIPVSPFKWFEYLHETGIPIFLKALFWPRDFGIVMLFAFFGGSIILWRKDKIFFWLLITPLIVTIIANFKFYPPGQPDAPHGGRLLLFLIPNIVLVASWLPNALLGWLARSDSLSVCWQNRLKYVLCHIFVIIGTVWSIAWNTDYVYKKEYYCEQVSELIKIININFRPGDTIFVGHQTRLAYKYYQGISGTKHNAIVLPDTYEMFMDEIVRRRKADGSGTVFVLFTHYWKFRNMIPSSFESTLTHSGIKFIKIPDTGSILYMLGYN